MKENTKIIYFLFFLLILSGCSTSNKDTPDNDTVSDLDNLIFDNEMTDEISDDENPDADEQNNLEEGPYGIEFGNTAGDFTISLETGDWNFAQNRSADENYIFIFYRASNSESTAIWKTDMIRLFDRTPDNTHYFFLV
ncbi:MAG TPA: membrane lipoprotein lipid attachment site-containing protein, partial [bacterium]|nr:membrane lipoprotein lipid attachment site-containing protein [bacterium]